MGTLFAKAQALVDCKVRGTVRPECGRGGRGRRDRDGSPAGPRLGLPRLGAEHDSPAPKGIAMLPSPDARVDRLWRAGRLRRLGGARTGSGSARRAGSGRRLARVGAGHDGLGGTTGVCGVRCRGMKTWRDCEVRPRPGWSRSATARSGGWRRRTGRGSRGWRNRRPGRRRCQGIRLHRFARPRAGVVDAGGHGRRVVGGGGAFLGQGVASFPYRPAVREGERAGLTERDGGEGAEAEFAAAVADDDTLDPGLGAGLRDLQIKGAAVAVKARFGDGARCGG